MGLGDIYDLCNTISLQNYEGAEGTGRLVFVRRDHPAINIARPPRRQVPQLEARVSKVSGVRR